jgi:hypothetical protein
MTAVLSRRRRTMSRRRWVGISDVVMSEDEEIRGFAKDLENPVAGI